MPVKNYSALALIYPHMMRSINYDEWADYIYSISKDLKKKKISALELASGTSVLAAKLQKKIQFVISSDLSLSMLQTCPDSNVKRVCCDMTMLPFKTKFDFVFSAFDSINYLNTKEKYFNLFKNVDNCLSDQGIFTFDVALENNSLKLQKYLNRKGRVQGIRYIQKSFYSVEKRIHYNHFEIALADGKKVEEMHKQKIFRFEDYFDFIDNSNFYVYNCFNAFTSDNADAESARVQFILKKKKYADI
jgi:SAM-dependent methyltransferase